MKTVHLTHWDLDAVVSTIFARKAWPEISMSCAGGYGKVSGNIEKLIESGASRLIVSDLCLTREQMIECLDNFEEVYYFDHHEGSNDFGDLEEIYPGFKYNYSGKMCGTALVYKYWLENGGVSNNKLNHLALITDTYDMWRTESTDNFAEGRKLNDLFWFYGYYDFEEMFEDGYDVLTEKQAKVVDELQERRVEIVDESPQNWLDEKSVVILLSDREALSDVQFILPAKVFYVLTHNGRGYSCSFRLKTDGADVNINTVLQDLKVSHPKVMMNGGGHAQAGGGQFSDDMDISQVMEFIEINIHPTIVEQYNGEI